MGNVFRRRRQPVEELDEIVKRLRELETQLKEHIGGRADLLRTLLFAAVGLWGAGSAYGWLHFSSLGQRLVAVGVALFIAVLAFSSLRLLCITGYDFVIERKRRRIAYFTERRVTIIEDVKENEKFKVAREIIEKYGDDADLSRLHGAADMTTVNPNASQFPLLPNGVAKVGDAPADGRRKSIAQPPPADTTLAASTVTPASVPLPRLHEMTSTRRFARTPVRPFVKPSCNPLDRLLDYVMGESINNRYALICNSCWAHNGMALREEFEQVAYFCFKCGVYNPSRNEMCAAAASGQQRCNGSPSQTFRRPSYSVSNIRTPFGSTSGGLSRTPSIRSLTTIAGHAELDEFDQLDLTTATDETTTRQNGDDAAEETLPGEPHQPASN